MAISIYSNSGNVNYGIKHYTVDTKEDLKKLPTNIKAGSTAFVVNSSKTYRLNSINEWKEDKSASIGGITPEGEKEINTNGIHDIEEYKTVNVNVPVGVFPEGEEIITENGNYDITEKAIARVNVPVPPEYIIPTGSIDITQNGQIPVAGKATANVNVPGIVPTGTKQISITANGTTTEDVTNYAAAEITVNTLPAKGFVLGDYDADGYPHSARFVGTWTVIPNFYCYNIMGSVSYGNLGGKVTNVMIPEGVTMIGTSAFEGGCYTSISFPKSLIEIKDNAFRDNDRLEEIYIPSDIILRESALRFCNKLKRVNFGGNVNSVTTQCFRECPVELYDFSHCTAIPPLYDVNSLGHASGCVIRIPAALSDTTLGEGNGWESATNWSALTNIVWEVV